MIDIGFSGQEKRRLAQSGVKMLNGVWIGGAGNGAAGQRRGCVGIRAG